MPFIRKTLRNAKVWARCTSDGTLIEDANHRTEILYQLKGKLYLASSRNLVREDSALISDDEASPMASEDQKHLLPQAARRLELPQHNPAIAVRIYTDGACTGNPGPMGVGVVILKDEKLVEEVSQYLGHGTNNIAELTAILYGLEQVLRWKPCPKSVAIYSDSTYAIGVLSKSWKATANRELIVRIKDRLKEFSKVEWVKVAAHAGIPENERCDELARLAIENVH